MDESHDGFSIVGKSTGGGNDDRDIRKAGFGGSGISSEENTKNVSNISSDMIILRKEGESLERRFEKTAYSIKKNIEEILGDLTLTQWVAANSRKEKVDNGSLLKIQDIKNKTEVVKKLIKDLLSTLK